MFFIDTLPGRQTFTLGEPWMKFIKPVIFMIFSVLALSSAIVVHASDASQSGFLSDYDNLKPNPKYPGSSDWINPDAQLNKYNAIIVDPAMIRLSKGLIANGTRPDPELLNEVLDYLHSALEREFSKHMKIATKPGDDVMHYRAAITGITTEGGVGSSAMNILPVVFALRTVTGQNTVRAHLFMESEYSDSVTGALLGAMMQSAAGGSPSRDSSGQRQIALKDFKEVLDQWAQKAAEAVSEALGK
jgi:hypothetical protein